MTTEIKVPVLPESVADATIAAWHKQAGDSVTEGENLVDLETMTDFNIETRYDDYRESLKKKANKSYTEKYLKITKKYLKCFLSQD